MDEEIQEALLEIPFQQHEKESNPNCHSVRENFQQTMFALIEENSNQPSVGEKKVVSTIAYENDQKCIQIAEDQGIQDCHSNFSSHVSCLEFLFQEEIFSPTCS